MATLPALTEHQLQEVFARPLIIGASVSADHSGLSPGKKLALRYTDPKNIRTVAENGKMGREVLRRLSEKDFEDRSVVIAVDLFFWDSTAKNVEESIEALHLLAKLTTLRQIPLILAEIPELLTGRQPGREKLNAAIAKTRDQNPYIFIMPFDRLLQEYLRQGYLMVRGKRTTLRELVPDGLHLNDRASEYLADILHSVLVAP